MFSKPALVHRSVIPEYFWEPHILGGYRKPGLSLTETIIGIAHIHNETFNIWTHLFLALSTLWYLSSASTDLFSNAELQPMLCVFVTIVIYSCGSMFAHTFCSMSHFSHHVSFMVDYYGISLYAFATSLANLAYAFPISWRNSIWEHVFLCLTALVSFNAVYLSSKSRFRKFDMFSKVMRVLAFIVPYFIGMSPIMYRVLTRYNSNDATYYYARQLLASASTLLFYSTHLPERLCPGKFDLYFHSHQLFHVGVIFTTYFHVMGLMKDFDLKESQFTIPDSLRMLVGVTIANGILLSYFVVAMYNYTYNEFDKIRPRLSKENNSQSNGHRNE